MQIKVLVFGQILDITGKNELLLDDVKDTDELARLMHTQFPRLARLPYRIAVDRDIITGNTSLNHQSIVALLPAYSGG